MQRDSVGVTKPVPVMRHLAPYRGARGGTSTRYANLPDTPTQGSESAYSTASFDYRARRIFDRPVGFDMPSEADRGARALPPPHIREWAAIVGKQGILF
jgi:hypothetical protein